MNVRAVVRAVVPLVLVVTTASTAFGAVPDTWTPVKDNPNVDELHPSPHGRFLGWAQSSPRNPEHVNFLVERKDGTRVKVNAAGAQGLAGDIVGRSVFYLQQVGDRSPRIQRYDLRTGNRTPLPTKVNQNRKREIYGEGPYGPDGSPLTASGPWLLFGGKRIVADPDSYALSTAMLYNRTTHQLRELRAVSGEYLWVAPGQVNGRYAVWAVRDDINATGGIELYDIKTHKITKVVPLRRHGLGHLGASVSADGTVYYIAIQPCEATDCSYDLVRAAPDGTKTVLATLSSEADGRPGSTYVKDRADGSHVVHVSLRASTWDIYRFVDEPPG